MKVLVMGGSRFNGLALVEELVLHGNQVTTFNRGRTNTDLPRSVRQLYGDRKDQAALREALADEDFDVVHDNSAYVLEDVQSMVEIFQGRTGHYIFASSCAVYDPAFEKVLPIAEDTPLNWSEAANNNYGRNKAVCERYLVEAYRRSGFPASITRYPMVYGPRNFSPYREAMMFTRLLMERPILIPGDGTTLSHLSYVRDQAVALRKMMLNPRTFGQAYNMASTEYYSDEGYVDVLAEIVGATPEKIFLPPDVAGEAYETMPYPLMQRHGVRLVDWRKNSVFSTRKFEEHVGYAQEHTFLGGMTETFEWYQREGVRDRLEFDFSHEDAFIERMRGR
jgi:nucleoside-diphosphate-sugar epimerase